MSHQAWLTWRRSVIDSRKKRSRFAAYYLKSIRKHISSDKATVPGDNRNNLHVRVIIFTTDTMRQKRIAGILFAYDDLIENNRRRIQ